jgi:hypothetical protein
VDYRVLDLQLPSAVSAPIHYRPWAPGVAVGLRDQAHWHRRPATHLGTTERGPALGSRATEYANILCPKRPRHTRTHNRNRRSARPHDAARRWHTRSCQRVLNTKHQRARLLDSLTQKGNPNSISEDPSSDSNSISTLGDIAAPVLLFTTTTMVICLTLTPPTGSKVLTALIFLCPNCTRFIVPKLAGVAVVSTTRLDSHFKLTLLQNIKIILIAACDWNSLSESVSSIRECLCILDIQRFLRWSG